MKKFIESIIEIILEDVSCGHQEIEEFSRGPKHDDPVYCLNDPLAVIEKCIKAIPARLIEKPEITVGFIEKNATELHNKLWPREKCDGRCNRQKEIKEFLSSLLNELSAKINLITTGKPRITKEFIENKTSQMEQMFMQKQKREDREFFIVSVIKEAQNKEEE